MSNRMIKKTVYLLPTNKCNLLCPGCCTKIARDSSKKELTLREYEKIIKICTSLGYHNFDISGGEPFLRDDLLDILSIIKKDQRNSITVVTNGTIANYSISELKQVISLVDEVHFSVESNDEEVHDFLRGQKGAFAKTIEFVKKINELKRENNYTCSIGFNYIWREIDENALFEIYRLATSLNLNFLEILKYIEMDGNRSSIYYGNVFNVIDNVIPEWNESKLRIKFNLPSYLFPQYIKWKNNTSYSLNKIYFYFDALGGCLKHSNNIVISATGEITACVSMLNCDVLKFQEEINSVNIEHILCNLKRMLHEREQYLQNNKECGSCDYFNFCKGGCPAEAIISSKSLFNKGINCPYIGDK